MAFTIIGDYLNIRGSAKINKGKNSVVVKLPITDDKFEDYNLLDFTIHITPYISKEEIEVDVISRIYTAGKINNYEFTVYGDEGSFYWMVQAILQHKYDFHTEGGF